MCPWAKPFPIGPKFLLQKKKEVGKLEQKTPKISLKSCSVQMHKVKRVTAVKICFLKIEMWVYYILKAFKISLQIFKEISKNYNLSFK